MSTIYLLHFAEPLGTGKQLARHYLGITDGPLDERINRHRAGRGSKLMAAVVAAGITFEVVRTWEGDGVLEQRLKNLGGARKLCPTCTPGTTRGSFEHAPRASRWVTTKGRKRRFLMKVRTRAVPPDPDGGEAG